MWIDGIVIIIHNIAGFPYVILFTFLSLNTYNVKYF
jgi:hypothetical protein